MMEFTSLDKRQRTISIFRQIDKITEGKLLPDRPEIPWEDVIGIRNHIAHGYFDIDGDIVFSVIQNELQPLLKAVQFFLKTL